MSGPDPMWDGFGYGDDEEAPMALRDRIAAVLWVAIIVIGVGAFLSGVLN